MRAYSEEMTKLYVEICSTQIARKEEIHALVKEHAKIMCGHTLFKNYLEINKIKLDLERAKL